eukprot:Pgem_evm2s6713
MNSKSVDTITSVESNSSAEYEQDTIISMSSFNNDSKNNNYNRKMSQFSNSKHDNNNSDDFYFDPSIGTHIAEYDEHHFAPDGKTKYFLTPQQSNNDMNCVVVIPFFNEEKRELKRTLESIWAQEYECCEEYKDQEDYRLRDLKLYYVAVMDGYYKAADSMIDYVNEMFGNEWCRDFGAGDTDDCTKILSKQNENGTFGEVEIAPGKFIHLTIIIKKQNRKKTNSHEWFFRSFVPEFNGEYAYTTDCGTLYAPRCLHDMLLYLVNNRDTSAVTGRQRVMSSQMQGAEREGILAKWYRAAQAYDYEASISAFQGAFSLCGMLPVLPGPCGMYRMKDIEGKGGALEYYMDFIHNTSPDDGLLSGNLMLAEDRILSYAAALKTGQYTRWVPSAVFYFEAETESVKFTAQRRRWTNGTFSCYLYLLFLHPGLIFCAPRHSILFKVSIFIQLLIQTIMYCITAVAPAIFISLVHTSVLNLGVGGSTYDTYIGWGVLGIYFILYTSFVLGHYFIKFIEPLYNVVLAWNTVMFFFILAMTMTTFINLNYVAMGLIAATIGFPFLLAILHSLDVFMMMVFNFLPFFLFLPTFVPWFMAYSLSRTWDLSWGNRPAEGVDTKTIGTQTKLKIQSFIIMIIVMLLNYGVAAGFYFLSTNTMVLVSAGIASVGLIQQFMSGLFYLFATDHTMSISFDKRKKSTLKAISLVLCAAALAFLFAGVFTNDMLTNDMPLSHCGTALAASGESVQLSYGVLFLNYNWIVNTNSANGTNCGYPDSTDIWGPNILWNVPNKTWSFMLLLLLAAMLTIFLTFISMVYSFLATDKSRIYDIAVLYSLLTLVSLFGAIIVFPFSWKSLNSYHIGWWDGTGATTDAMCGSASFFNLGDCSIGYSYIFLMLALVLMVFSHNTFRYTLQKEYTSTRNDDNVRLFRGRVKDLGEKSSRKSSTVSHFSYGKKYNKDFNSNEDCMVLVGNDYEDDDGRSECTQFESEFDSDDYQNVNDGIL